MIRTVKRKGFLSLLAVLFFIALFCGTGGDTMAMTSVKKARDFRFTDINGKSYDVEDFKTKSVILLYGRSGCSLSTSMLSTAANLKSSGVDTTVVFLGVDSSDSGIYSLARKYTNVIFVPASLTNNNVMWSALYSCGCYSSSINLPGCFILDKYRHICYYSTGGESSNLSYYARYGDLTSPMSMNLVTVYLDQTGAKSYNTYYYTGKKVTPKIGSIYASGGKSLVLNKDYTVSYSNNTKLGTATITITGKGGFTGKITKSFEISTYDRWVQKGSSWYYYIGDKPATGWMKYNSKWYFFAKSGVMMTGWAKLSGKWYYFGTNGVMQTDWKKISGKWYYFGTGGAMQTDWKKISGKWYYFGTSGAMQTNWKKISGKWYYFGTSGVMQTGWKKISGIWYYFGNNGDMQTGWKRLSGEWYYFTKDGAMVTGKKVIDGKTYQFRSSGTLITYTKAGIAIPDASGWTSAKKIYVYSWDEDLEKKMNIVLDQYPQFKDYVEFVTLWCSSNDAVSEIEYALSYGSRYPSIISCDANQTRYWVESDKTLNLYNIGFNSDVLKNSYQDAIDLGTYGKKLKAVSWDSQAGSVFYNRRIAKEVFGTDDQSKIQAKLKDWDSFFEAAEALKQKGYKIVSGPRDIYYAVTNARTTPWVSKDKNGNETFKVDSSIETYIELAKRLSDGDYTNNTEMWDGNWADSMKDGDNVFCYFGCTWMTGVFQGNGATNGSWGICNGPTDYYWGGTYLSVGAKTPNKELCAFLLAELTCDPDIGVKITNRTGDAVNNKKANQRLQNGELSNSLEQKKFFKSQNPYAVWAGVSSRIHQPADYSYEYDYGYGVEKIIIDATEQYIDGTIPTKAQTIQKIYDEVEDQLGIPSE